MVKKKKIKRRNDVVLQASKILNCKSHSSSSSGRRKKSKGGRRREEEEDAWREEEVSAPGEEEKEHTCGRRRWSCTLSWSAARPRHSTARTWGIFDRQTVKFSSPTASLRGGKSSFLLQKISDPTSLLHFLVYDCVYIYCCL